MRVDSGRIERSAEQDLDGRFVRKRGQQPQILRVELRLRWLIARRKRDCQLPGGVAWCQVVGYRRDRGHYAEIELHHNRVARAWVLRDVRSAGPEDQYESHQSLHDATFPHD